MKLPSYIFLNKFGIYYFRICFPKCVRLHLQKIEFRRSLRTREKKTAAACSRAIKLHFDELCRWGIYTMDWLETKFVLTKYVDEILIKFQENIMEHGSYGDHLTNYPELSVEKEAANYIILLSQNEPVDIGSFPLLKQYTAKIVEECNLESDPDKQNKNLAQVAEMLLELKHNRMQLLEELCISPSFLLEKYKNQFENYSPEQNYDNDVLVDARLQRVDKLAKDKSTSKNNKYKGITLRQLIDKYVDYKTAKKIWGSPKTIQQSKQRLDYLHEFFEFIKNKKNIQLHDFENGDAIQFEKYFQLLPKNRTKKYPNLTIKELIIKSESCSIPLNERISATTYNGYVDLLSGMFSFAMEPRQNFISQNVFIDLKIKNNTSTKRLPFSSSDLNLFFSTHLYQKKDFEIKYSWRFWIPILMCYHGFRLEEVAQLQIKSIVNVNEISAIEIKEEYDNNTGSIIARLKNTSSERIVPIHSTVLKIGFLNYVEYLTVKGRRKLFPDLSNLDKGENYKKAGAKVSRWFNEDDKKNHKNSYLTNCKINGEDKERKVLYSFRHTVQHLLNNHPDNIENDKIDQLFGHSIKSIGRKHYGGYDISTLHKVVELINYPDAKLPWDINPDYHKIKFPWE